MIQMVIISALIICVLYFMFRKSYFKEGLENQGGASSPNSTNGVAGNASTYAANIKSEAIKLHDTLLVSKYKKDYENVIMDMDDYVDNLMLQTLLNIDTSDRKKALDDLTTLNTLNESKTTLNKIMSFIDGK